MGINRPKTITRRGLPVEGLLREAFNKGNSKKLPHYLLNIPSKTS
jgi:hypothetical protein